MIKFARVAESNSNFVRLDFESQKTCIDCKSRCADGFLSFIFKNNTNNILVKRKSSLDQNNSYSLHDEQGFFEGDFIKNQTVGLKFDDMSMLKLSLLLYGFPLLCMIVGLMTGISVAKYLMQNADLIGLIGLIFGLFISVIFVKGFKKRDLIKVSFFK